MSFTIPFGPIGPFYLALSFIVSAEAQICIELGFDCNWGDNEYSFDIDVSGKLKPSLSLDFGVYYPSPFSPVRMSLNLGFEGTLTAINAGMKLNLLLKGSKYKIDLYYEFTVFEISFYILLKFELEIKLVMVTINYSFKFEIYAKTFFGLSFEKHLEKYYKYWKNKEIKELD